MARGKEAAQAANRRLIKAQERIAGLEKQAAEREAAYRAEVTELRTELARTQGTLSREVRQMSEARVVEERERASLAIKEVRDAHLDSVVAGMAYLESRPHLEIQMTQEEYVLLAESFGVDIGPLLSGLAERRGEGRSRETARTTNGLARTKYRILSGGETGGNAGGRFDRWRESG